MTPITTTAFDPATGGYTRIVSVVDPQINLQLDPDTRAPRTDEYSVGVDREIGRRLAVAIAYVRKDGGNFIGWTDVGGQYREETRTLPDGRSVPVFVLVNAHGRSPLSADESRRVLADLQRPGDGRREAPVPWLAGVRLLHVLEGVWAAGVQRDDRRGRAGQHRGAAAAPSTFGRDPNDLTNARGRLPNDRPHMFRVMGSVDVPRTGFVRRRQPAALQRQAVGGDGAGLAAAGRSARVCSSRAARAGCRRRSLLDRARVEDDRASAAWARVELLLDVLNVLNDTAEEGLATDNLFSPNFGQPTALHGSASRDGRRAG